jgi:hypothetical protein
MEVLSVWWLISSLYGLKIAMKWIKGRLNESRKNISRKCSFSFSFYFCLLFTLFSLVLCFRVLEENLETREWSMEEHLSFCSLICLFSQAMIFVKNQGAWKWQHHGQWETTRLTNRAHETLDSFIFGPEAVVCGLWTMWKHEITFKPNVKTFSGGPSLGTNTSRIRKEFKLVE